MPGTMTTNLQAVSEWVKVFPKQVTENYTSSVTFMKQLTVVAISTITYLKNAFPEDNYMVETFGGIKLRILKNQCRDELAQFLSTALSQAFEAFDKRYLHQLALCFYESECKIENLIEYHIFEYLYHEGGVTMSVHSKTRDHVKRSAKYTFENVKERTINMIRSCVVVMQSCQNELPPEYDVSVRLYYNDEAPADYQAPGYHCTGEGADPLAGSLADTIKLGWVETPYHTLLARSYIKDTAKASHEAIASQNPPVITQAEDDSNELSPGADVTQLRCPCNKLDSEPSRWALLTCHYCGTRQHAACFGVARAHAALVARHCCAACHDAERARRPTDAQLAPLGLRKRESLCIFRRTLDLCTQMSAVEAHVLASALAVSDANAVKLMKVLDSHKIITMDRDDDATTPQKIRVEHLKSVMGKFFHSTDEDSIVDRLLVESFASQESHSDPISEVLSPLEKATLQNSSSVCRVAEPPRVSGDGASVGDATLKQYREAVLSNDKVEEPASVAESLAAGVQRRSAKRKVDEGGDGGRLGARAGVRTKRARSAYK